MCHAIPKGTTQRSTPPDLCLVHFTPSARKMCAPATDRSHSTCSLPFPPSENYMPLQVLLKMPAGPLIDPHGAGPRGLLILVLAMFPVDPHEAGPRVLLLLWESPAEPVLLALFPVNPHEAGPRVLFLPLESPAEHVLLALASDDPDGLSIRSSEGWASTRGRFANVTTARATAAGLGLVVTTPPVPIHPTAFAARELAFCSSPTRTLTRPSSLKSLDHPRA